MGCRPAVVEANLQGGPPAQAQCADFVRCNPVYRTDKVPIGAAAQGLSALHSGSVLFYRMRDDGLLDVINGAGGVGADIGRSHAVTDCRRDR